MDKAKIPQNLSELREDDLVMVRQDRFVTDDAARKAGSGLRRVGSTDYFLPNLFLRKENGGRVYLFLHYTGSERASLSRVDADDIECTGKGLSFGSNYYHGIVGNASCDSPLRERIATLKEKLDIHYGV